MVSVLVLGGLRCAYSRAACPGRFTEDPLSRSHTHPSQPSYIEDFPQNVFQECGSRMEEMFRWCKTHLVIFSPGSSFFDYTTIWHIVVESTAGRSAKWRIAHLRLQCHNKWEKDECSLDQIEIG